MRVIASWTRELSHSIFVVSMLIAFAATGAQGAAARAAKDPAEQSKAVTAAVRFLQGPGFIDPMLSAVNTDSSLTVQVDRGWTRMNKAEKYAFLERVNTGALNAAGGVAIDIQVTVSGAKVASSSFTGGQQTMRLLVE